MFSKKPRRNTRSLEDFKQEALFLQGKAQFEKLLQKGLQLPIALL